MNSKLVLRCKVNCFLNKSLRLTLVMYDYEARLFEVVQEFKQLAGIFTRETPMPRRLSTNECGTRACCYYTGSKLLVGL